MFLPPPQRIMRESLPEMLLPENRRRGSQGRRSIDNSSEAGSAGLTVFSQADLLFRIRHSIVIAAYVLGLAVFSTAQSSSSNLNQSTHAVVGVQAIENLADQPLDSGSSQTVAQGERPIPLRLLLLNILKDQKNAWLFPRQVVKGRRLKPTLILLAGTGALVALDPYDEPYFRNSSGFQSFRTGAVRGRNTTIAILAAPAGLYLAGIARNDSYAKNTALLAGESIVDAQILSLGIKLLTGRSHPSDIPAHGNFRDTWFKYQGTITNPGSFPSGHALTAFATAAVIAKRYRRHRWVPWLVYTGATAIALSRIPDQAHFPSDVFAGAAMGYILGRFIVPSH
jgi:membrane-associated phospholipid phosphatase